MEESGYLFVWKPVGWTSFDCIRKIKGHLKSLLGVKNLKIGHSGVLDPIAEGLLLIGFGEAPKFFKFIEDNKVYEVSGVFGKISDTYDSEGDIKEGKVTEKWPSEENIDKVIQDNFIGKIKQIPPIYSNIKIGGKSAHKIARSGKSVGLKPREKNIYSITLLEWKAPKILLEVECESGTYMRSLIHDLGQILKTGAYCDWLKRTQIGQYSLSGLKVCKYNEKGKEFDIEGNVTSLNEMFSKGSFIPLKIDEFFADELLSKAKTYVKMKNLNSDIYPVFSKDKFIGFASYNSISSTLIAKRLISN